jgi:excisionase family DNA binding protein
MEAGMKRRHGSSDRSDAPSSPLEGYVFFTVAEIADRVAVSTRTVRRWVDRRKLVAHHIGGLVRIAKSDLETFLARHRG